MGHDRHCLPPAPPVPRDPAPAGAEPALAIAERFAVAAPITAVRPFGSGLINRTYLVTTSGPAYVLQRLNGRVFPRPAKILENLERLTRHLQGRTAELALPALIPTRAGELGALDGAGNLWRMLEHVPDTQTLAGLQTPGQAAAVGTVLARFHRLCAELSPAELAVTLPGFHVAPRYQRRLHEVLAGLAPSEPAQEVRAALDFIDARTDLIGALEAARAEGHLPLRIVHGDPKLDNVLFDLAGERAITLIDLDTVQPGLVHHDLGDCLRSCCNRRGEAAAGAAFDVDLCRALLAGYAAEAPDLLTVAEIGLLYDALRLIPLELGMRFLTDHLEGDRYFRVRRHGENLHKAQAQIRLVADIERRAHEIRAIIAAAFAGG